MAGIWRADSVSMELADAAAILTLPASDHPMSLIFSEKTCTVWLGDKKVASLSYSLDPKQNPWTLDMKFEKDEVLLGICTKKDDNLTISLDDKGKGRARDFDKEKHHTVFVLRRFRGVPLLVMNFDGSSRRTFAVMSDYTSCGSPRWSRDGHKLAFDGWRSWTGQDYYQSHIFVANADGSGAKDLGDGSLPSMSPDNRHLAYVRFGANYGVWLMNAVGNWNKGIDSSERRKRWIGRPTRPSWLTLTNDAGGANLSACAI